jgi:RNA polymerase sigma-70 factor (ECF subfamily)
MNTNGTSENVHDRIVALLPRLRRFARNLTRNPHDADDVVQIALERALLKLDQWRSDARLDSWMLDREVERLSVQSAMARLPEEQRTAVSLVLVEGLPYKEAAEVLEIPIGTLTSRLARARQALQAMLEPAQGSSR